MWLLSCSPPRRPIAEASFLPVRGRRDGISIVELLEGLHDAQKSLLDQAIDAGTSSAQTFTTHKTGLLSTIALRINREAWAGRLIGVNTAIFSPSGASAGIGNVWILAGPTSSV